MSLLGNASLGNKTRPVRIYMSYDAARLEAATSVSQETTKRCTLKPLVWYFAQPRL